jgi:hypothetical protein
MEPECALGRRHRTLTKGSLGIDDPIWMGIGFVQCPGSAILMPDTQWTSMPHTSAISRGCGMKCASVRATSAVSATAAPNGRWLSQQGISMC